MAVLDVQEPMQREWCRNLGLREGSSFADGAHSILKLFAEQTSLPRPGDFPRNMDARHQAARDLHPQPPDDSAFQP